MRGAADSRWNRCRRASRNSANGAETESTATTVCNSDDSPGRGKAARLVNGRNAPHSCARDPDRGVSCIRILVALAFMTIEASTAFGAEVDLLDVLQPAGLGKVKVRDAPVCRDPVSRAITVTYVPLRAGDTDPAARDRLARARGHVRLHVPFGPPVRRGSPGWRPTRRFSETEFPTKIFFVILG